MAEHKIDGNNGAGNAIAMARDNARDAALVEAAAVAIARKGNGEATLDHPYDKGYLAACDSCAAAILALRDKPAPAFWHHLPAMECELECKALRAQLAAMTAERDELASAIDSIETNHGLTDNGNLWRFWAKTAREIAAKNTTLAAERDAANARADQAEYRIVHIAAGLFPGGFDNNVAAIRDALRDKPAPGLTPKIEVKFTWAKGDEEFWVHLKSPDGKSAGFNLGNPKGMIATALLRAIAASEA